MKRFQFFQTNKAEKITAVVFLIFITWMAYGLFFTEHDVKEDFVTDYRNTVLAGTPIVERVVGAIDSFERTIDSDTYHREKYIDFYGRVQELLGKNIIVDIGYGQLYKTTYGQITYAVPKQDVTESLNGIYQLKDDLNQEGIPLLFVQAPFKLPEFEQQLPANIHDYSNDNANRFLQGLAQKGIDYLDLRQDYWSKGLTQNQLFFNTDHHWTIQGAFQGFQSLVSKLNGDYGFHIDEKVTDLSQYNQILYPRDYIGSMGRRVGESYSGVDDFTLITPKFDTDYTVYERDYGGEKVFEGTFDQAVLNNSYMEKGTPLDTNRYAVYHGDNTELEFINHDVENGKILIIKDSFGLPIYCFLSAGVHEVRALDLRLYDQSVAEYAKEFDPDLVIVFYNTDCYGGNMFDFNGSN